MGNNWAAPKALAPSIPMPPLADCFRTRVHLTWIGFVFWPGSRSLAEMMEEESHAARAHGGPDIAAWGRRRLSLGQARSAYHGGKVKVARPRGSCRARQRGELGGVGRRYAWMAKLLALWAST